MNAKSIVIGGGISGLSAAYHLQQCDPQRQVTLLESSDRVGGVIKSSRKDGFLLESAADNFITTTPAAYQLCQELGLSDELIRTNPGGSGAMVVCRGRLEPIPPGFAVMAPSRIWPLLATRILSPMGKLRSGCEIAIPRKQSGGDESLQSFVIRRFGREMFERLVQPLVGGIYTADPTRLSIAATMPRFQQMEQEHGSLIRAMMKSRRKQRAGGEQRGGARYSQFMTLRGGMSRMIESLAGALPSGSIRLNYPVREVTKSGSQWSVRCQDGQRFDADSVVIAAPAKHAASMLGKTVPDVSAHLAEIPYASCAIVSLAYRRSQFKEKLSSFGFVVPRSENRLILSCSFTSEKYEGRAPDDTVLMRAFIGGAMQSGLLRMPNSDLIELAKSEIQQLLSVTGQPILQHIHRQNEAMPQYHVGHKERVQRINRRLQHFPALALAGSSLGGVGVPGCIESGRKAAERIAEASPAAEEVPSCV